MNVYEYSGIDSDGKVQKGVLEAESLSGAYQALGTQKVLPTRVRPLAFKKDEQAFKFREIQLILEHMASLLEVGYALKEALQECVYLVRGRRKKSHLMNAIQDLERGKSFHDSISGILPSWISRAIRMGEESAQLPFVLRDLATEIERRLDWKNKWTEVLFYPIVLIISSFFVMAFVFYWTMPLLESLLLGLDKPLPLLTQFILGFSRIIHEFGFIILTSLASLIYIFLRISRTRMPFIYRLEYFKSLIQMKIAMDFSRFVGIYLKSGVSLIEALDAFAQVEEKKWLQEDILELIHELKRGKDFRVLFEQRNFFPSAFRKMLASSQAAGNLEEVLGHAYLLYHKELNKGIARIHTWFGPVITIAIGIIIGILILALYLPLLSW